MVQDRLTAVFIVVSSVLNVIVVVFIVLCVVTIL